ncbi:MAG TPA: hypothetical protein DDY21_01225 [Candidatus Moranbacteria bacterium]|nr:hypothetical protein [Candidatus Moranbacteria bacterium]HCO99438.1 hypothetical protein [Candidatus Moranbacteria bacterium]
MKGILLVFFISIIIPTQSVSASEDHQKPTEEILTKKEIQKEQKLLLNNSTKSESFEALATSSTETPRDLLEIPTKNERDSLSLAVPTLLDMDYTMPYIIAAATAKDPNNISSQRVGYTPIYYYYDTLGDLDYVTNNTGTTIADVSYCDGTESYFCPSGWLDWIDFLPLGAHAYLEFHYDSDTPNKYYYAKITDEPELFFYNINMADGNAVTNTSDPLYWDTEPVILADTSEITGYIEGTAKDPDWSLWFDNFSEQRLTDISNNDFSKRAIYSSSTSNSIYRFFNKIKGNHFYTKSKAEKNNIRNTLQNTWNYEGVAWYIN